MVILHPKFLIVTMWKKRNGGWSFAWQSPRGCVCLTYLGWGRVEVPLRSCCYKERKYRKWIWRSSDVRVKIKRYSINTATRGSQTPLTTIFLLFVENICHPLHCPGPVLALHCVHPLCLHPQETPGCVWAFRFQVRPLTETLFTFFQEQGHACLLHVFDQRLINKNRWSHKKI